MRDLNKLWVLNLNTNWYKCYDHDIAGNRIFIGDYPLNDTQVERVSFEDLKKSLNGNSYKGVSLHKKSYLNGLKKCWHSKLNIPANDGEKRKSIHLGSFTTPTEAALAWNEAVKEAGLESIRGLNKIRNGS